MSSVAIRTWLGIYNLVFLGAFAAILLVGRRLLPLSGADVTGSFEILAPFLLGQVTLTFRFYVHAAPDIEMPSLPKWVVIGPPILASILLTLEVGLAIAGKAIRAEWVPSPDDFKFLLTFCVTLLSASTVYVSTKYFHVAGRQ